MVYTHGGGDSTPENTKNRNYPPKKIGPPSPSPLNFVCSCYSEVVLHVCCNAEVIPGTLRSGPVMGT